MKTLEQLTTEELKEEVSYFKRIMVSQRKEIALHFSLALVPLLFAASSSVGIIFATSVADRIFSIVVVCGLLVLAAILPAGAFGTMRRLSTARKQLKKYQHLLQMKQASVFKLPMLRKK